MSPLRETASSLPSMSIRSREVSNGAGSDWSFDPERSPWRGWTTPIKMGLRLSRTTRTPFVQPIPPEWQEPDDPRPRYRLCRVAFFLGAASMALFALSGLCQVLGILGGSEELLR